jgi:hypothetical protein
VFLCAFLAVTQRERRRGRSQGGARADADRRADFRRVRKEANSAAGAGHDRVRASALPRAGRKGETRREQESPAEREASSLPCRSVGSCSIVGPSGCSCEFLSVRYGLNVASGDFSANSWHYAGPKQFNLSNQAQVSPGVTFWHDSSQGVGTGIPFSVVFSAAAEAS